jgi:peroxiredoxin
MSELRGLGVVDQKLKAQGGRMVTISADKVSDSKRVADRLSLPFDVLSDNDLKTIRAYGLFFHEPHMNLDTTLPAHFLIDKGGVIRWRFISPRSNDRPDPDTVIAEIEKLK